MPKNEPLKTNNSNHQGETLEQSPLCLVYITVPSEEVAEKISKSLLQERLIACANLSPAFRSTYLWKGKVEEEFEHILILKTQSQLFSQIEDRVRELHPFETPCILQIPIEQSSEAFSSWLISSTS